MIQAARSASSQSLLREAETAIFLIQDANMKAWLEAETKKVIAKRRDPDAFMTGATDLKRVLLAYLSQQGDVKTANIWCRSILSYEAANFLKDLNTILQNHKLAGVVELHWQDRELNSPHIQYVGTNAEYAEVLIAEAIVARDYERNISEALTLPKFPAYISEEKSTLRVIKTDEIIKEQEEIKQATLAKKSREARINSYVSEIKSSFNVTRTKLRLEKTREEIEQLRSKLYSEVLVSDFSAKRRGRAKAIISDIINKDITDIVSDTNIRKFSNRQGDRK